MNHLEEHLKANAAFAVEMQKLKTVERMRRRGGSFVAALAAAWSNGDATNRARIEQTWPELFTTYAPKEPT